MGERFLDTEEVGSSILPVPTISSYLVIMDSIHVTFPDGKSVDVRPGAKIEELAVSAGVKKTAVAAKIDGHPVDLSSAIDKDCALEFLQPDSAEGLDVLRHSTAHLMAQAVQGLFPGTQVTIGPTIEDGFYYDFKSERAFTPEDLALIEKRMEELAKADLKVVREEMPRRDAIELFRKMGENYKVEIIEGIADDKVSLYRQGDWVDLCRGPHVPSTGSIKAFKLTSIAGAVLARRFAQRAAAANLRHGLGKPKRSGRLSQARGRGETTRSSAPWSGLGSFSLHPIAPGSPFFHPKGTVIYNLLVHTSAACTTATVTAKW